MPSGIRFASSVDRLHVVTPDCPAELSKASDLAGLARSPRRAWFSEHWVDFGAVEWTPIVPLSGQCR